jgi:hypothetical protein
MSPQINPQLTRKQMTNPSENKIPIDASPKRTSRDYIRRADGSWNVLPLVLGALAIAVAGYVFLGDRFIGQDHNTPGVEKTLK